LRLLLLFGGLHTVNVTGRKQPRFLGFCVCWDTWRTNSEMVDACVWPVNYKLLITARGPLTSIDRSLNGQFLRQRYTHTDVRIISRYVTSNCSATAVMRRFLVLENKFRMWYRTGTGGAAE